MPRHRRMQPIDPDEFNTALNFAMNAGIGRAIVEDPTKRGLNIVDEDGEVTQIRFTDIPMNRALMAIHERYEDDTDKYVSIASRIFGVFSVIKNPALSEWIRVGPEFTEIHPAITNAAATVMMNYEGVFPLDEFLSKVKELAATKYKDEEL